MASAGPNSPGTISSVSGPGNNALGTWGGASNSGASDNTYSSTFGSSGSAHTPYWVQIIKGGTVTGTNKGTSTSIGSSDAYVSFGGASDLWGTTWSDSDINASNFGVAFAVRSTAGSGSYWLQSTNFGFAVPSGATIDGILAEVECYQTIGNHRTYVDHVRITVYYTESGGGLSIPIAAYHYNHHMG